jgi:sialidase-1
MNAQPDDGRSAATPLTRRLLPLTMMMTMIMVPSLTLSADAAPAPKTPERVNVFTSGQDSYPAIRIPSLVLTRAGTLLAFAEGRENMGDQAGNKIIQKRSTDGGKTWSPVQTIAADGRRPLNNPCAVVDQNTGQILLMFQSYPADLKEASGDIKTGYDGDAIVKSYLIRSRDDGKTWSRFEDVTRQVKRPTIATTVASGPGIGIQVRNGPHIGRLILPFNEGPFGRWNIYAVYSDDGGRTWKYGKNVPDAAGLVNECQIAELPDGSLLFNSRRGGGGPYRKSSLSRDGGVTWSPVQEQTDLFDPTCMASILALPDPARPRLLFAGPLGPNRSNGTVHVSYDNGQTWPVKKTLFPGNYAYSVLVALPSGTLGVLYETDDHQHIAFARFTLADVTDGADTWNGKPMKR